jgi:hypothetical protein
VNSSAYLSKYNMFELRVCNNNVEGRKVKCFNAIAQGDEL